MAHLRPFRDRDLEIRLLLAECKAYEEMNNRLMMENEEAERELAEYTEKLKLIRSTPAVDMETTIKKLIQTRQSMNIANFHRDTVNEHLMAREGNNTQKMEEGIKQLQQLCDRLEVYYQSRPNYQELKRLEKEGRLLEIRKLQLIQKIEDRKRIKRELSEMKELIRKRDENRAKRAEMEQESNTKMTGDDQESVTSQTSTPNDFLTLLPTSTLNCSAIKNDGCKKPEKKTVFVKPSFTFSKFPVNKSLPKNTKCEKNTKPQKSIQKVRKVVNDKDHAIVLRVQRLPNMEHDDSLDMKENKMNVNDKAEIFKQPKTTQANLKLTSLPLKDLTPKKVKKVVKSTILPSKYLKCNKNLISLSLPQITEKKIEEKVVQDELKKSIQPTPPKHVKFMEDVSEYSKNMTDNIEDVQLVQQVASPDSDVFFNTAAAGVASSDIDIDCISEDGSFVVEQNNAEMVNFFDNAHEPRAGSSSFFEMDFGNGKNNHEDDFMNMFP